MKFTITLFVAISISLGSYSQKGGCCLSFDSLQFSKCDQLNKDLSNTNILLLGEIHLLDTNPIIQVDLLMYLNQFHGFRNLLIEFGKAEAYLLNKYLETGDQLYLDRTTYGIKEIDSYYSSMEKLYNYNLKLSSEEKIVIHGLDFEREPSLSVSIVELLSDYKHNKAIDLFRQSLVSRIDTIGIVRDNKDFIEFLKTRIKSLDIPNGQNKSLIMSFLENEAFFVNMSQRDHQMTLNYRSIYSVDDKYFGQFGAGHTMLTNPRSLAYRLNFDKDYTNKLLVINMYLKDNNPSNSLSNLMSCPNFLYRLDESDPKLTAFRKRGQWVLVLENRSQ